MASRALAGPAKYLAQHPLAWAASMSGAGTAAGVFAARSVKSRGSRRIMWAAFFALEVAILAGVFALPRRAQRSQRAKEVFHYGHPPDLHHHGERSPHP
jgi:hypothetical protein